MGSSGIQITANIASTVEKLYTWIRSPTWVTAGFAQKYASSTGGNFNCTTSLRPAFVMKPLTFVPDSEDTKSLLERDPALSLKYSKMVESELNKRFRFIIKGTPENAAARKVSRFPLMTGVVHSQEPQVCH
jgi:cation diffusion facilitator CzcD-associated flavoprotein CzcO